MMIAGGTAIPLETIPAGTRLYNYTLFPLGPKLTYREGAKVVDEPTLLSALMATGTGTCHWAACRLVYPG